MEKPTPPPEAVLIRRAREAARIKTPAASRAAGISTARWSQVENGYETRLGRPKPVRAPAGTLAHMAHAVGVTPERLEAVGRSDAAEILREIILIESDPQEVPPAPTSAAGRSPEEEASIVTEFLRWRASQPGNGDGDKDREHSA